MSAPPAFWLVPLDEDPPPPSPPPEDAAAKARFRAVDVVLDPSNVSHRCWLEQEDAEALRIGFASTAAQVTLGSRGADIYLPDDPEGSVSDIHCSFSCEKQTGAIVLTDYSQGLTKVFDIDDDLVIPISEARNSVVVSKSFNRRVSIASYRFRLLWESDVINRYLASDSNLPTLGPWGAKGGRHRYIQGEVIGMGACGHVWKAVDLQDGKALAVKRFFTLEGKRHEFARREVRSMIKIQNSKHIGHEHILKIFDVEYDFQERWIEMFMPLKEGSVKSLVGQLDHSPLLSLVARGVYQQMLKALCCIAQHGIIHRDLKPDNILYESRFDSEGAVGYHFYLADFGLSHEAAEACTTRVGTEAFMAPEVLSKGKQTAKMDVWSLFATIVWILDAGKFRNHIRARRIANIVTRLVEIADMPQFERIRRMAEIHPDRRPSSQELLASELDISLELPDTFDDTIASCSAWLNNAHHKLSGTPSDAAGIQDADSNPSLQSRSFSSDASVSTLPSIATPDSTPPVERPLGCFHTDIDSFSTQKRKLRAFSMVEMPITRREKDKQEMGSECSGNTMATDPASNGWECLPLMLE